MDVLIASTPSKLRKDMELTIDWAIRAIARLGGYLEHRKNVTVHGGDKKMSEMKSHGISMKTSLDLIFSG